MIKKILLAVALLLPLVGAQAQTLKIGLVDVNSIVQAHPDTQEAQNKLQAAQKQFSDQNNKLLEEGQRLVDEFQKLPENTIPAIRDQKARDIQNQQDKIQQFLQTAEQELQRMQSDLMGPIVQKVRDAIESVGKEGSYSLVQNYEPSLTFYYAAPIVDITPDVKAKLGLK